MKDDTSLMKFPCDFVIKIIGVNEETFKDNMVQIVWKHFPETKLESVDCRPSQEGRYLAITVRLYVHDQPTLDGLYQELSQHPDTRMVL